MQILSDCTFMKHLVKLIETDSKIMVAMREGEEKWRGVFQCVWSFSFANEKPWRCAVQQHEYT